MVKLFIASLATTLFLVSPLKAFEGEAGEIRLVKTLCLDEQALVDITVTSVSSMDEAIEEFRERVMEKRCGISHQPFPVRLNRPVLEVVDSQGSIVETWEVSAPNGRTVYCNFVFGKVNHS